MLLQGGYGYGNILRLRTAFPLERRLRPGLQSSRKCAARPLYQRLAAYDIVKTGDDSYRISVAVAGFAQEDLDITFQSNLLTVTGKKQEAASEGYLHRGIAGRPFEHRFELADHVRVNGADLSNGLLSIDLKREIPEALKPRKITIESSAALTSAAPAQIEAQKAA
jgi:molecular chaperone IbpA